MICIIISLALLLPGLALLALSVFGIFRFSTTMNRIHALRCDLTGATLVILGIIVISGSDGQIYSSLEMLAIAAVIWLISPAVIRAAAVTEVRRNVNIKAVCDILEFSADGGKKLVPMDDEIWDDWMEEISDESR